MKSSQLTALRPYFSLIWAILLIFACLLPLTMSYPALAVDRSPQSGETKENSDRELPASVLKAVQGDLAKQTHLSADEFKLREATRQSWTDGCLGLGKPEELCTQAIVDGWRVSVVRGKQTWIYRTDRTGRVLRPEQ